MTSRTRRLLFIAAAVALVGVFLCLIFAPPVLFSYAETASLAPQPVWRVLNPLRSRAPERPAEALLRGLKQDEALQLLRDLQANPPVDKNTIENEQQLTLISWRLMGRKDFEDEVELLYHVARVDYPHNTRRPVWIRVTPTGEIWQVTSFSAIY